MALITTVVAGNPITPTWGNQVRDATVQVCTAATRPSSPAEGMIIYQTDTDTLLTYSGAAWSTIGPVSGALTSWTPTMTQNGAIVLTATYAKYQRVGRMIHGWFNCIYASGTGTASNPMIIGSLPATAASSAFEVGVGNIRDSSATSNYTGDLFLGSTTTLDFRSHNSTADDNRIGVVAMTAAFTAADTIRGSFCYEAAADA